jgi:hypothetical protein
MRLIRGTRSSPATQPFLAVPGVIAVVDSVVAGATIGIAGLGLCRGTAGCLVIGGIGLLRRSLLSLPGREGADLQVFQAL